MAQIPGDSEALVAISRFLSKVLRHEPELLGLRIDSGGWVAVDELLQKLNRASRTRGASKRVRTLPVLTREVLLEVVENNDKQRFALSGDGRRIRAVQGHSVDVELTHPVRRPPATLFHGTAAKNWSTISVEGLKRGRRHAVHLSLDIPTAIRVGARHGRPVVLQVDAAAMQGAGHVFSIADNGVWLIEYVPPQYLSVVPRVSPVSSHLRHDLRSLALHQEAVRALREQPELAARAIEVLARWEVKGDVNTQPLWDAWRRIIEGKLWHLAVEESDRGQQLRQASPLGFVLSEPQRKEIFRRFRRSEN